MRVTNQMMSNRMLTNINRNLGLLDKYNTQGSTGKRIQNPSDDPIIASRALKFRTMVAENSQYSKNAVQSSSWIDTTENVFVNVNKIVIDLKGLVERGANGTMGTDDRKKLMTEYKSLLEQLEQELNTDYMGRNIFSGYRTDEKPITQDEQGNNIPNPKVYGENATIDEVAPGRFQVTVAGVPPVGGGNKHGVPEFYTNPTTGQKTRITQYLYNDGTGNGVIQYDMDDPDNIVGPQNIEVQLGGGVGIDINTLVTDVYSRDDFNNLRFGEISPPEPANGVAFAPNMHMPRPPGQPNTFRYEGKTELDRMLNFLGSDIYKNMSEQQKLDWENQTYPAGHPKVGQKVNDIQGMMSKMLTTLEKYQSKVATKDTELGIKSKRVELVQTRLKDDELNYKTLLSENEDIDIAEVMMNSSTANAAYMASLNLGMKVNQMTLADYLR